MKKRSVFTTVFVIFAAVAIALGFFALKQKQRKEAQEAEKNKSSYTLSDEQYFATAQPLEAKLYESDIDGLFYSLSPVQYYRVESGVLHTLQPTGTLETTPVVAGTKMHFKISYVRTEDALFGVGLWHSDAGIYNYAFAVIKQMPKGLSAQPFLLLIDTTQADLCARERNYSELLALGKDGTVKGYIFDQSNRTVEHSGKLRTDWDVLNLRLLKGHYTGKTPSLTGRKYNQENENAHYDLRLSANGATQTAVRDVSDTYIETDNEIVRFIRTGQSGWSLVENHAAQEKIIASFEGNLARDYVTAPGIVLRKADNIAIRLSDAKQFQAPEFKKLYAFAADEERIVYIGKEQNRDGKDYKVQKIMIFDTSTDKRVELYANNIMDEDSSLSLCAQGILTCKGGKSVFISYNMLETIAADVVK